MHKRISHQELRRLGWTRMDPRPWSKCSARWRHRDGWRLEHCGHPTALYPWSLYDPRGRCIGTGAKHGDPDMGGAWPSIYEASLFVASALDLEEFLARLESSCA